MVNNLDITNARLPGDSQLQRIYVDDGKISAIVPMEAELKSASCYIEQLDVKGDWISLGGIDLQINGGLGLAFPDLDINHVSKLTEICQFLWQQGVDGFLPTLVTTSIENMRRSLALFAKFQSQVAEHPVPSAQVLGVHLEGPFLNPEKRGAHPAQYLLPLTVEQVRSVLGDYAFAVKLITLAPELDPMGEVISYLRSLGIIVSLGHSLATAAQAQAAFDQGAAMVTHAFNAMPGLHHREPGLLGAALVNTNVFCGFIADGQHVHPTMLKVLLRAGRNLFLVSDALAPLGLPDGVYPWDTRQIQITKGTARLENGTLAGTTLPLLVGAQNLVKWKICLAESAIALATDMPRRAIGLPGLQPGQPANFLRWRLKPSTGELIWQRLMPERKS